MSNVFDVVVVGGGINGASIAYNLSKQGKKVVILEKNKIACESSSAAAGMLAAQAELEEDGSHFRLALKSQAMFPAVASELLEQSGIDIELVQKGMLKVAETEEIAVEGRDQVIFQKQWDNHIEWLDEKTIREMEPALSNVVGGMYLPNDSHVHSTRLTEAFAKSAENLGTVIHEGVEVHSFIKENGQVTGVKSSKGDFHAAQVVLATGAWASHLLNDTGLNVPIFPVKGECFSVKPSKQIITRTIFSDKRCYLVPKKSGEIYIGATMIPDTFDQTVTAGGISTILERAIKLVPDIQHAEFKEIWAGVRPQTGDGFPYIGEHPSLKGLFVASGHFRNGILLSPITGKFVADLLNGHSDPLLDAFRLDRHVK